MNPHPSSLVLKIIRIILIVGIASILLVDSWLIFIQPQSWQDNTSEVTCPFLAFFLLPILILYFSFKDYAISVAENRKLHFTKSLMKGVFISIMVGIADTFIAIGSRQGEEMFGLSFILPVLLIGGSIFQLVLTTIFYFKSSKRVSIA